ncbi:MAG: NAD-dependent dehydratase [Acidimicrobiales bacterium]
MSEAVASGKVEWSGENPFIYLKSETEPDWSVLAVSFRITVSEHGLGHAIVVLEEPYRKDAPHESLRICVTDNMVLARFLVDHFVRSFAVFRNAVALDSMEYMEGSGFARGSEGNTYIEFGRAIGAGPEVTLSWENPGVPFAVDVPPAESGTGRHEMFSVFRTADDASIVVDGRRLPGHPVERDFFGARSKSAGLAFSETWVLPA